MSPADIERERSEQVKALAGALKDGRMPTTDQAIQGLDTLKRETSETVSAQNMSTDGKKVMADIERLLGDSQNVLKTNNPQNELQNAIYYAKRAAENVNPDPAQANDATNKLIRAGARVGDLAQLIATSPEFRQLVSEIVSIAQSVLRRNIQEASDDLANDENVPDRVRNAAASTRDKVEQTKHRDPAAVARETENQARGTYEQTANTAQHTADNAQSRARIAGNEARETVGDSLASGDSLRKTAHKLVDVVAGQAETHLPPAVVDNTSAAIKEHGAKLHIGEATPGDYKDSAASQLKQYRDQVQSQIQDPNSQLRQTTARVAGKLANLPEGERRDIINRLKVVIKSLQAKPEFQQAIDDVMMIMSPLVSQAGEIAAATLDKAADAPTDPHEIRGSRDARLAIANAKQLIENLANGQSLNNLIKAISELADQAREDQELEFFQADIARFLRRTVKEVGFVDRPGYEDEATAIMQKAREQFDKYSFYTQKISYEASNITRALARNKTTQKIADDTSALLADLFLNEKGDPTFKPELVKDLASIIPSLAEKLAYLPIPRIEVDDGEYQLIFDNIVLHSTILPKYVHLVSDTKIDASQKEANAQVNTFVMLEISKIEASSRDIAWLINKHSGLVKMGDVGLADFDVKGEGLSLKIKLRPGENAGRASAQTQDSGMKGRYVHAEEAEATLHDLSLRLHDSHHDTLYKVLKPIITKTAKKQIERAIADTVLSLFESLDQQISQTARAVGGAAGISVDAPPVSKERPEWSSAAFNTAEE